MPKQARWAIKRDLDQIHDRVTKSRDELVALANLYNIDEDHRPYMDLLMKMAAHLDSTLPAISAFRDIV